MPLITHLAQSHDFPRLTCETCAPTLHGTDSCSYRVPRASAPFPVPMFSVISSRSWTFCSHAVRTSALDLDYFLDLHLRLLQDLLLRFLPSSPPISPPLLLLQRFFKSTHLSCPLIPRTPSLASSRCCLLFGSLPGAASSFHVNRTLLLALRELPFRFFFEPPNHVTSTHILSPYVLSTAFVSDILLILVADCRLWPSFLLQTAFHFLPCLSKQSFVSSSRRFTLFLREPLHPSLSSSLRVVCSVSLPPR